MKKIILTILLLAFGLNADAKSTKSDFESILKDSDVNVQSVSISIKNEKGGKPVYAFNDKILMNPASVQKMLTIVPAIEALGENYEFSTELYKRKDNSYIIKLGADPFLTSSDLKKLAKNIAPETTRVQLDDSVLDGQIWGEGWQWDDDLNAAMPRFGSYNLDGNLLRLTIKPSLNSQPAKIVNVSRYPLVFINNVVTADSTDIKLSRESAVSENTIVLTGTVARPTAVKFPLVTIKKYFNYKLLKALNECEIYPKTTIFNITTVSKDDTYVSKVTHPISNAVVEILKNSNNLAAETVFKLAGAKSCNLSTGTASSGIEMFNKYCNKHKLDVNGIRIVDGSGVSKNNLVSADFVTEFLAANRENKVFENLPRPGEGTLTMRMLPLKDNLRAKTGNLASVSSLAGYLTSKSGKKYVFCIFVNDTKLTESDKKTLEDYIIREAYLRL